jgi:hypothetical protein
VRVDARGIFLQIALLRDGVEAAQRGKRPALSGAMVRRRLCRQTARELALKRKFLARENKPRAHDVTHIVSKQLPFCRS